MNVAADEERRLTDLLVREVAERERPSPQEERILARTVREGLDAAARLRAAGADLRPAERERLAELVERGTEAKRRLVTAHLPLVAATARRYRWSDVPFLDLFQEGTLGLLRAAERFDWRRGTPFAAYAVWWVKHAILRALREQTGSIKLPERRRRQLRALAEARAAEPAASDGRLASSAGLAAEDADVLVPLLGSPLPIETPPGPDRGRALEELLADRHAEEALEEVLVEAEVSRLLAVAERTLTSREREVLEARYGLGGREPATLRAVGERLGVTPQRVAQIEAAALAKLREALAGRKLAGRKPAGRKPAGAS